MNTLLILILFPLFATGVGGTEVKSLSVKVGDSVTLNTDFTDIQKYEAIWWRFEQQESPIAEVNRTADIFNTSDGPDGRFRDRLHLDHQTGSLTIIKAEINHSGQYEVEINSSGKHIIHKTFNVTVSDEIKKVLVTEGDYVTLHTDTEKMDENLIDQMFANAVIANISEERFSAYGGPDEKFKDRQTNVTVRPTIQGSGLSSSWLAGIGAGVVFVVVVLVAVTVYCCWCRMSCWWW